MNAPVALSLAVAPATPADLRQRVERAARAVAPLWPIATFAARSPWQYLEELSFDSVARQQQARHGIPLYPALPLARRALARGEIAGADLLACLQRHLARSGARLPRDAALAFLERAARGEAREVGRAEAADWRTLARTCAGSLPALPAPAAPAWPALLDHTTIRYVRLHVGAAEAAWPLPGAADGLFAAWRALAEHDPLLPAPVRAALATCPQSRDTVLAETLHGLDDTTAEALLADHLMALPGWAGWLRWQGRQAGDEIAPLLELLALRLALAPALPEAPRVCAAPADAVPDALLALAAHGGFAPSRFAALPRAEQSEWLALAAGFDERARERVLLEAVELGYRRDLERRLAAAPVAPAAMPAAQLVFCIDVRSEPLRRALEAAGPFATFGFAGFFGLPVRTRAAAATHTHAACPVILAPKAEVREIVPLPSLAERLEAAAAAVAAREDTARRLKHDPIASLALPELGGLWHGLRMAWQSLLPAAWRHALAPAARAPATTLDLAPVGRRDGLPVGLTLDQQVDWTAAALRGIGLVRDFAPLVVVVGHGSRSRNNPYAAKLDCGACGGASGAFNARLLVTLANTPLVRAALRAQGIAIPPGTRFVAAEHVTSLDTLEWLDVPPAEGAAADSWRQLLVALPAVTAAVRHERLAQLPRPAGAGMPPASAAADALEAWHRASDWSETRPEWGLARNAAFIIGRRALTANADLDSRAFLHSYDWRDDPDGRLLAGIVAGPVTVGQWINLQYYASTVAPAWHGSGSKTTQTVTAGVGVMQGNASDLLPGLPWQAVMADDSTPWHRPQRLLVVIEAPAAQVQRLLQAQPDFAQKVRNGWLRLASIDPETRQWRDWS